MSRAKSRRALGFEDVLDKLKQQGLFSRQICLLIIYANIVETIDC